MPALLSRNPGGRCTSYRQLTGTLLWLRNDGNVSGPRDFASDFPAEQFSVTRGCSFQVVDEVSVQQVRPDRLVLKIQNSRSRNVG